MALRLRTARDADAAGMLAIYEPFVRTTAISFELEPPDLTEFTRRVRETREYAPWLVCESDGAIAGYAYGSKFRPRPAYRWTIEVTVYVSPAFHRRGIGRALYEALLGCVRAQGYQGATAGIALPNDASIRLHESVGFRPIGVFHAAGFKLGAWHDVAWYELTLGSRGTAPAEPLTTANAQQTDEWHHALARGESLIGQQ